MRAGRLVRRVQTTPHTQCRAFANPVLERRKAKARARYESEEQQNRRLEYESPGTHLADPFEGKELPFGAGRVYKKKGTFHERQLAKGYQWHPRDREHMWHESNMLEIGHQHLTWQRPYEDLLDPADAITEYYDEQLAMGMFMMSKIPHVTKTEWYKKVCVEWEECRTPDKQYPILDGHYNDTGTGSKELDIANSDLTQEEEAALDKWVDSKIDEHEYVKLTFIDMGGRKHRVYGLMGESLLNAARRWGIRVDGMCQGGDLATPVYAEGPLCHHCQMDISPKYAHVLPPITQNEEFHYPRFRTVTKTSRLGCQLKITPEYDGMVISVPLTLSSDGAS